MAGKSISAQNCLALSPWFFHYAMQLFNPQSGGVFSAKAFRRKTNLSGGRVSNSAQSFEIIKRTILSIVLLLHQNTEITIIIADTHCVFGEYTWNNNNFSYFVFPWFLSGTIIQIMAVQCTFTHGRILCRNHGEKEMCGTGGIMTSQGLEGPEALQSRLFLCFLDRRERFCDWCLNECIFKHF